MFISNLIGYLDALKNNAVVFLKKSGAIYYVNT